MLHSLYKHCALWLLGLLLLAAPLHGFGDEVQTSSPVAMWLPSAEPSGNSVVDKIWFFPYLVGTPEAPAPVVILLHGLGADWSVLRELERFARTLNHHGISAVVMMQPYHFYRFPPHDSPYRHFTPLHVEDAVQAFSQSASDVRTLVTWLTQQPNVNPHRIGVIGISLGAIVAHLAMGQDARLTAGVAILGGGDVADLFQQSGLYRFLHPHLPSLTQARRDQLARIDPLTYASQNLPRHVLMIEAARDQVIPPQGAEELWNALDRPPIRWMDTNHFGPQLLLGSIWRISEAYLIDVWNGSDTNGRRLPPVFAPTIKFGVLVGLDAPVTPALQWQALSFAERRDHMSLLHTDLGWAGNGPFLGVAVTLHPFMDVGLGHRFLSHDIRPYLSFHIVF